MQQSILDFLHKLAAEGKIISEVRNMLQAEIDKYSGMRMVLSNTEKSHEITNSILAGIDNYLKDLELVQQKFRHTFLALVKINPEEDPEINRQVLQILKNLNQQN